jgi:chromate transporter
MDQIASHPQPSLIELFRSFFRLGLTAFGGPAMVAYIRKLAVEKNKWLSPESFRDGVALCQTVPGATAMQTAAYVGLRTRGIAGAAACFIGFGLPAFCLMIILSAVYQQTQNLPAILSIFRGLRVIIVAVVANATLSFGKTNLKDWKGILIAAVSGVIFALGVNPIWVILLAIFFGMLLYHNQTFPNQPNKIQGKERFHWTPIFILGAFLVVLGILWLIDRQLFDLSTLMARIDLMAFGGGFASVPLMYREVVNIRSWTENSIFMDGIALGQITPGPIVITATFVGFIVRGLLGAVLATVSIFIPSFLMVVVVTPYFDRLCSYPNFNRAIEGILRSFVGLLLFVTFQFAVAIPWDIPRVLILGGALVALLLKRDVLWVVLIGAVVSAILL